MAHLGYVRFLVRRGVYFCTLALWGFSWIPVAFLLAVSGHRFEVAPVFVRSFHRAVGWLLGLHIELEGAEHLTAQPVVLMLNHQSQLDVWLLGRSAHNIFLVLSYLPPAL
jgi:lysophosphatidate acyltransferase